MLYFPCLMFIVGYEPKGENSLRMNKLSSRQLHANKSATAQTDLSPIHD